MVSILSRMKIKIKTRIRISDPSRSYACEACNVGSEEERRIDSFELFFLLQENAKGKLVEMGKLERFGK